MTPIEAFEAWFESLGREGRASGYKWAKKGWLAACAWQREQDARVAENLVLAVSLVNPDLELIRLLESSREALATAIADAIRAQEKT